MVANVAFCADLHFGKKNNNERHNQLLCKFIENTIDDLNERGIENLIIAGDYFDNRQQINVKTLHYGIKAASDLKERYKGRVWLLVGNHDIYHRDRLDIASTEALEPYMSVVDEEQTVLMHDHMVQMVPWICDQEHWERVVEQSKSAEYCFGHFEFSQFRMNENYIMEHGQTHRELHELKRVLTGHFHSRQFKDNVVYIGSPFQFDMNDSDDFERGYGIIDLDTNEIEFVDSYLTNIRTIDYKQLLDGSSDRYLNDDNASIRVVFEEEVDDDILQEVSEKLESSKILESKIKYKPQKIKDYIESDVEVKEVENIDDAVLEYINSSKLPDEYDKDILIEEYKEAMQYD